MAGKVLPYVRQRRFTSSGLHGLGAFPPIYITGPDGQIYIQPGNASWGTVQYVDSSGAVQYMQSPYIVSTGPDGSSEVIQTTVSAWPTGSTLTPQTQGPYANLVAAVSAGTPPAPVAPVTPVTALAPVGSANVPTYAPQPFYMPQAPTITLFGVPLLWWVVGAVAILALKGRD